MICIFSRQHDRSTLDVMRWLQHLHPQVPVIRINYLDELQGNFSINICNNDCLFSTPALSFNLKDIKVVWYRKGKNWLCDQFFPVTIEDHDQFSAHLKTKLQQEEDKLSDYLHYGSS